MNDYDEPRLEEEAAEWRKNIRVLGEDEIISQLGAARIDSLQSIAISLKTIARELTSPYTTVAETLSEIRDLLKQRLGP